MTNRMELYKAVRETGLNGLTNKAEKVVSAAVETISETPKQKTAALVVAAGLIGAGGITAQASTVETQPSNANSSSEAVYVVKNGDTFYNIAKTHGMNTDQLKAINPKIKDVSKLGVNQKINLSQAAVNNSQAIENKGGSKSTASTTETYTVKQGDNMYRIAINHGISLKHLQLLNPQVTGNNIMVGQVLKVSGTPFAVKPVEKPQQKIVQTEQDREVECEVIGVNDENSLYVYVDGERWVFYAGGEPKIQKEIASYKEGDFLDIRFFMTEHNQFQIKDIVYKGNRQVDRTVDFDGTFVSIDSNSKRVSVKNSNGNVVSYKISDYLASENLYFKAGSNVRLVGEKTTNGDIVIENISL
ncbi:LysM peptidoglycan-binding domain-containing protein [Priestia aryabhattai]|uniref:LysM peptidoglycan-binding domain-containing protein n=1 Tax=Priestia aryabhattai TaxID=412384 RepID=A0AAX6NBD4_PRIAR|nr:LysM peptidoglycan-binding domain-containing protein [Priestia aryabhattai]MDU9693223.1 LysM peptidoglycan-binding domain-containing protein [Priestia aryabhattai]